MTHQDFLDLCWMKCNEAHLREILRDEFGARCYRTTIVSNDVNNVHVRGPFPNAIGEGWYLLGDFQTVARDRGLVR